MNTLLLNIIDPATIHLKVPFSAFQLLMPLKFLVLFMENVMSIQQMDFNLQNQMSISLAQNVNTKLQRECIHSGF